MRKIVTLLLIVLMVFACVGCSKASAAKLTVQADARDFKVERRISVINTRTDAPIFAMTGYFVLSDVQADNLTITSQTGENEFRVNYVHLNDDTVYFIEDITGAHSNKFRYEIYFYPDLVSILLPYHE